MVARIRAGSLTTDSLSAMGLRRPTSASVAESVTVCPAWERPRAAAAGHGTTGCDLLAERDMILGGEPGAGRVTQAGGDLGRAGE